jgi:type IV secretory pathway VirB3-like protein
MVTGIKVLITLVYVVSILSYFISITGTYNYLLKWLLPLFLVVHLLEMFTPFAQQVIHASSNKKGAIIQSLIWGAAYWLPEYNKLGH